MDELMFAKNKESYYCRVFGITKKLVIHFFSLTLSPVLLQFSNEYTYHHSKAYNSKTIEFQDFWPVLFQRGQYPEQDECIFMQFNSNSRPRAPFEARKLKKLLLLKISRNLPEKELRIYNDILYNENKYF